MSSPLGGGRRATIGRTVALTVFTVWSLFPIYWIVQMGFKKSIDTTAIPPKWLFAPTLDAYRDAFTKAPMRALLLNSLQVAVLATAVSLAVGLLAAYGLVRLRTGRAANYEFWVLSTRMAPPVAVALPFYLLFQKSQLLDTVWALALMHVVMVIGMVTWIMIETFHGLPQSLTEAALVDGCGQWTAFRRIMLPLAVPGLVGAGVLAFLLSWNEFFFALILTSGHTTAPVGLFNFVGFQSVDLGALAAAATILLIPAFVIVLGFQKFLVRGLTMGAVKG
ncbi:carbohydrate ABC transporter permease [Actinomadura violacea]|uniref:Carbohydrate ABC transporter permease n=1 Tax=Actinomadura violacea TaxID=2819934 RepID=A0ABS3S3P0_9ACTN|nr:carbohydrate ABC transporter permease [Actinomadura violacea]MBO2463612.1 carbohydrate ABC transporter permease [Actinomadura violacea]